MAAAGAVALTLAGAASADPVTFRATVATDIRLGTHSYRNADLLLTFVGDTQNIAAVTDASGTPLQSSCQNGDPTQAYFFWIPKGSAAFSFESGGQKVSGHFLPGQVFVSVDVCSGGIGFGSYIGPNGLEPVYPLGFTHGSAQTSTFASASPLSTAANSTGNAWSCINFPIDNSACTPPDAYPLHTDAGDLFIYMPYLFTCGDGTDNMCLVKSGSMNRGTFSVVPGVSGLSD
jgi:hypothetical protein